jgi:hypothetical protein
MTLLPVSGTKSEKTEFIIFSSKCHAQHSQSLSIHLDGHTIKTSRVIRDLGVLLDEHLTLENHVCKVRQLAFMSMRIISKVRRFLSKKHAELLIDALAFSRINFCISLFAGAPKSLLKRLQSILHYGVRIIEKMKKFNDVTSLLKKRNCLNVHSRIQMRLLQIIHTSLQYGEPKKLTSLIEPAKTNYVLRSETKGVLNVPRTRKTIGCRAFAVAGPKAYNLIPEEYRRLTVTFKDKLKLHLLESS